MDRSGCEKNIFITSFLPLTNYEHMLIINFVRSLQWQGPEIAGEWVPSLSNYFKPRGIPLSMLEEVVFNR